MGTVVRLACHLRRRVTVCSWTRSVPVRHVKRQQDQSKLFCDISPSSSQLCHRADFERVMEIYAWSGEDRRCFVVHEHLLRPLSRLVREYRPGKQEDHLKWQCDVEGHHMVPQTVLLFLQWLYHNSLGSANFANGRNLNIRDIKDRRLRVKVMRIRVNFPQYSVAACKAALEKKQFNHSHALEYLASTVVQDNRCGFSQLLDLYMFANIYEITIFKNVIIDHLIEEASQHNVPPNWSKKIYSRTKPGDQLRRLWVDFYIWRVDDEQLDMEQREDLLDSAFVKDLLRAQARELRGNKASEVAPFDEDSSAYHVRDEVTGQCCCRTQFEGDKYEHRGELHQEQLDMQNAQAKVEELEYKNSELREALRAQKDQDNRMSPQKRNSDYLPDGTKPSWARR